MKLRKKMFVCVPTLNAGMDPSKGERRNGCSNKNQIN